MLPHYFRQVVEPQGTKNAIWAARRVRARPAPCIPSGMGMFTYERFQKLTCVILGLVTRQLTPTTALGATTGTLARRIGWTGPETVTEGLDLLCKDSPPLLAPARLV